MVQMGLDEMEWTQVDVENEEWASRVWTEAEHAVFVEDAGCGTLLEWQVVDSTKNSGALSSQSETGPAAAVDSETEVYNCWDNCQNLDVESQGSS